MTGKTRGARAAVVLIAVGVALIAGCGGDDFENTGRAPVPVELTGVIQDDRVTVSPSRIGAGAVVITISNQTKEAHSVILAGGSIKERVGPINPLDTGTLQKTLNPGTYEVRSGSAAAVATPIKPATLVVGARRRNADDDVQVP